MHAPTNKHGTATRTFLFFCVHVCVFFRLLGCLLSFLHFFSLIFFSFPSFCGWGWGLGLMSLMDVCLVGIIFTGQWTDFPPLKLAVVDKNFKHFDGRWKGFITTGMTVVGTCIYSFIYLFIICFGVYFLSLYGFVFCDGAAGEGLY